MVMSTMISRYMRLVQEWAMHALEFVNDERQTFACGEHRIFDAQQRLDSYARADCRAGTESAFEPACLLVLGRDFKRRVELGQLGFDGLAVLRIDDRLSVVQQHDEICAVRQRRRQPWLTFGVPYGDLDC